MREVFSNQDLALVSYYKGLLDDAEIPSYIRNENGGNPDVAGISFQPTLCVITNADFEAAIALLKSRPAAASSPRAGVPRGKSRQFRVVLELWRARTGPTPRLIFPAVIGIISHSPR